MITKEDFKRIKNSTTGNPRYFLSIESIVQGINLNKTCSMVAYIGGRRYLPKTEREKQILIIQKDLRANGLDIKRTKKGFNISTYELSFEIDLINKYIAVRNHRANNIN